MRNNFTHALATTKRARTLRQVSGYTAASTTPMSLMFGQPNNIHQLNFKMESVQDLTGGMMDILAERSNTLTYVLNETLSDVKAFFSFDSRLAYEVNGVPYSRLATVRLQNIIGLKSNLFDYTKKLDNALALAMNVLEYELSGLTKLVAQLLTDKGALTSTRPISAIADLKMHTTDVDATKVELATMLGHDATLEYVEFGSIYFSLDEWKDCNRRALNISQQLKKAKLDKYAKDVKNTTVLMEKLLMRMEDEVIPKANIEDYTKLIEQTSNNVAFAGATIHMCQTLLQTLSNHNEVLRVEIDDYKKHRK